MNAYFEKVKSFLLELDCEIISSDSTESIFIISKESSGISNMIIDCDDPILVMEQYLFELANEDIGVYRSLLAKNRDIIHGAIAIDDDTNKVLFRDTLQLENLDLNELAGTLNSIEVFLSEYMDQIITFSKN